VDIRALGYIGLDVADIDAWRRYVGLLGAMVVADSDGEFRIKIDERPYRLIVTRSSGAEGLAYAGWELPDAAALGVAVGELRAAGHTVDEATSEQCRHRQVRGMVRTVDPGGFAVELFWGPIHDHTLFVSPAGVSGFVTGDMGLGHIVLGTPHLAESIEFYTHLLGFRVSDVWRAGTDDVVFTHCNPRHHSLALAPSPTPRMFHFMIEAGTLDDVGYALDRHYTNGVPITEGLGKHTNDHMVSFYSRSPSGFDVEFGCGGIRVDDATWTVSAITKPSFWGHRRTTSN
jgi:3,4-dihydroxy-9,10-secoandrosta-1,3,5(10)-triene-9,17-dione 4,5-dioxygenase